ncbi:LacI family DNA-binding transcriptional regulator [Frigidibacter sp. ROC022]|uniref:LacI family DNA-binding transcriptional regulator n=1 Tax=Frigidibacter sp. ROC022 TaxID=2971796 RepID=UPI00215B7145|nr:LacI family DNA-binding transcriptional regulator [Frigidibacter sp. ROC022]MCR8723751.1 LacI family DNA-binding transcriptional regulator [Frigidibacter sp. ROC022]
MKKVRLRDVAKAAGVSPATVDRVINHRPGVRPETVRRVEAEIDRLGYGRPAAAGATKAMPTAEPQVIEVLLPIGVSFFAQAILAALQAELGRAAPAGSRLAVTDLPSLETEAIIRALDDGSQGAGRVILMGLDSPEVRDAILRRRDRGQRIVTLASSAVPLQGVAHVGIDDFAAGRTAGALMARMIGPDPAPVHMLMGDLRARLYVERRAGFEQSMAMARAVEVRRLGSGRDDPDRVHDLVAEFLSTTPGRIGLYIPGGANVAAVRALSEADRRDIVAIGHELTPANRAALLAGHLTAVLAHDVDLLARRALEAVLAPEPITPLPLPIRIWLRENLPAE